MVKGVIELRNSLFIVFDLARQVLLRVLDVLEAYYALNAYLLEKKASFLGLRKSLKHLIELSRIKKGIEWILFKDKDVIEYMKTIYLLLKISTQPL